MIVGRCQHCHVCELELERLPADANTWPILLACAPCCAELLADESDAVDHEAREACDAR